MKILWAIDVSEDLRRFNTPILGMLHELARVPDTLIYPLCLVSRHRSPLWFQQDGTIHWLGLEQELTDTLKTADIPGVQPPRAIAYDALAPSMIAEKLIENAREVGVDAIAVTNHATRGPKRWLSGSVCERLLYDCRFPLIVCRATEEPV